MSIEHKNINNDNLHDPKDFSTAANETAPVKDTNGNLEWRSLTELGATGPEGPAGTTLPNIAVADINDPSPELASQSGSADGDLILVHEVVANGPNPLYSYQWDTSVGTVINDPPFVVPGDGGSWVNGDIFFFQGKCSADQLSATSYHGRIFHVHRQGRWYGLHAGGERQILSRNGYNRSTLTGNDVSFHEQVEDKVKTKTLSSNTTLTFSGYQILDTMNLEITSTAGETLTLPSYAIIDGKYDTSGVINYMGIKVANPGTPSTGTITVISNSIDAGDSLIINGVPFTQGSDWVAGVDTAATAFNICRAISESNDPDIVDDVIPTVSGSVITITAYAGGVAGDNITMVESDGATNNFTLSGPTLTGGSDGAVLVKIGQTNDISIIELQDQVNLNTSTGIVNGGSLSVNGGDNTKFDIADGTGTVVDSYTDPDNPVLTNVEWSGLTAQTAFGLGINEFSVVGINSVGAVVQQVTPFTATQRRDIIKLGTLVHVAMSTVESTIDSVSPITGTANRLEDLGEAIDIIKVSGAEYSANGSNLNIDRSEATHYAIGKNYDADKKNPDTVTNAAGAALSFFQNYRDGVGGTTIVGPVSAVDSDFFDDGSGTLVAVPTGEYQIKRGYFSPSNGVTIIEYGQSTHNSLGEAEALLLGDNHIINPDLNISGITLHFWLIVKEGATDLSVSADAKFITPDSFGLVPAKNYSSSLPLATQAEAEAGTSSNTLMTPERVNDALTANATPATKEMFINPGSNTASNDNYSIRSAGSTADANFSFFIPHDFTSLVSMEVILSTSSTIVAQNIDISSSYALIGQSITTNQESDTTTTYSFTADQMSTIDVSGIFTSIAAGHFCGLEVDHLGIGTTARYLGLRLRYS